MNSKKNLVTIVIIIIVLVAGAVLWRGGFLGQNAGTAQPGVEGQNGGQVTGEQAEVGDIGKMTEDIFIEVTAQMTYFGGDPESAEYNNKLQALLNKYSVNMVNYGSYIQEMFKDINRATAVSQKVQARLEELQKTGGK